MKNWSLNAKMYFVLAIFTTASALIAYIGLSKMSLIKDSLNGIVNGTAARVADAHELREFFFIQLINEKNLILESSVEDMKPQAERLQKYHVDIQKKFDEAYTRVTDTGKKDLDTAKSLYNDWWKLTAKVQELSLQMKDEEAYQLSKKEGTEIRRQIEELMEKIVDVNEAAMKAETVEAEDDFASARNMVLATSILAIFLGFTVATLILRALGISIGQVIASLTDNSAQVTSAAQQIASSSEELSQSATEQAASLEETAASIEEMNSMVQKNAENAGRASELASSSNMSAEKGKKVVKEMIVAIDDITESNNTIMKQIDDSNQKISDIVKVIAEIGNKTKVINDIVFQTKLLSFNASVEAARAGEHGKGFAVVAEEVGNLAQMSGNAAKEISTMLDESIGKVESIVNETKSKVGQLVATGKGKVEVGSRVARQCEEVLEEIVDKISNVTLMANEISTACQEQAQGVQEITKAMNQLDQLTQSNAATSEEAASAAVELSSQAESLTNVVGILVTTIKGGNAAPVTYAAELKPKIKSANQNRANVVPLRQQKSKPSFDQNPTMKKASGYDSMIPSEDDPRFKDI
jgi:methyl-accepting chemotaxis protein